MTAGDWLGDDEAHWKATHDRWVEHSSLRGRDSITDQCGGCRYFLHLEGRFSSDWGVCSNPMSANDGMAIFEHDGCSQFEPARDGWGGAHRSYDYLRRHAHQSPRLPYPREERGKEVEDAPAGEEVEDTLAGAEGGREC